MEPQAASRWWAYLRRYWINLRRRRFWLIVVVLGYTLAGFVALPLLAERLAVAAARDYSRELRVGDIRFNPYTLALEVRDLALQDVDGARLIGLERLFVNFTLASAWKGAWTFEAIHVDGLDLREERFASGATRLAVLADSLRGRANGDTAEAAPDETASGGPPPVLIEDLRLRDGRLRFRDHVPQEGTEFVAAPIDVRIEGLDTRPERRASTRTRLGLGDGGTVTWQGQLQLVPLRSSGQVTLEDIVLDPLEPYLHQVHKVRDFGATLDASFDYSAALPADGPRLEVTGLEAALGDVSVAAFEPETEFLAAERVTVAGLAYRLEEQRLDIGSFAIEEPALRTWLKPDGEPALLDLLPPGNGAEPASPGDDGPPLSVQVDAFRINGLDLDVADRSLEPWPALGLRDTDLAIDGLDLAPGTDFDVRLDAAIASGGTVAFDGRARIRPQVDVAGALRVSSLALAPAEPYLQQFARLHLAGGRLALDGRIESKPDEPFAYRGGLQLDGLDLRNATSGDAVLGWRALTVDALDLGVGARRLETSVIRLQEPFARLAIAEDRSTNIGRLLVQRDEAAGPATASGDDAFGFTLGGLALADGELAFSDRSLPLPFATRVHALEGRISTVASGTSEPADIALEGQVEEYGLARIDGAIDPTRPTRSTDIRMEFRNLAMPDYSPYAVEFAGRRIAGGRMDLDLAYRIQAGRLEASNAIVLKALELGEKVASPDAVDLPLGLAVALLKDGNGVIDVELPVAGDLNDPSFRIGAVIGSALTTLVKKIVSSPFRLLASLVGLESGELDRVEFLAGRSDLTPPQRERVGKLAEALAQRPEVLLEIGGTYAPALDRPALQRRQALAALRARLEDAGLAAEDVLLTDEAALGPLTAMYREAFPDADQQALRERFTRVPADEAEDAEPVFDPVAYQKYLAREVTAAQSVPQSELTGLARARAQTVRAALTSGDGAIAGDRLRVREPASTEAGDEQRVPIELDLAAD